VLLVDELVAVDAFAGATSALSTTRRERSATAA
jgi:hypothetical protein